MEQRDTNLGDKSCIWIHMAFVKNTTTMDRKAMDD